MNYAKHYNRLIERATTRKLNTYTEKHHIIPRCLGGTNETDNLVALTPEEHYVAHQLLVKMYPDERSLVHAALMMSCASSKTLRNNKRYGWLRRRYQLIAKQRTGKKNGSYGRSWYYNLEERVSKPFGPNEEIPEGWHKGRVIDFDLFLEKIQEKDRKEKLKKEQKELQAASQEKRRSEIEERKKARTSESLQKQKRINEIRTEIDTRKVYEQLLYSGMSLSQFADVNGYTKMSLSRKFKKFIPEYRNIAKPRVSIATMPSQCNSDNNY